MELEIFFILERGKCPNHWWHRLRLSLLIVEETESPKPWEGKLQTDIEKEPQNETGQNETGTKLDRIGVDLKM